MEIMMIQIGDLYLTAQQHKGFLDGTARDIKRLESELKNKEDILKETVLHKADLEWAYKYLDSLVKVESERFIRKLEEVLNYAMRVIFYDRNYTVDIIVEDNKRASIHLTYEDEEGNKISPDVKDVGVGVRTVIGVVLQILFISCYDVERLLIVDEGFSQLSENYAPKLFGLFDELSKSYGLKVLLITHDVNIEQYANKSYVIENHRSRLTSTDV